MPRDTGAVLGSLLKDSRLVYFFFVEMVFSDTTLRWTTYSAGVDTVSLDLGDGSEDWDCTKVWEPGQFEQSDESSPLTISDLSFGNANNYWSDRAYNYGWRGVPVKCWIAFFDKDTKAFIGAFVIFEGVGDRIEIGDSARASLLPGAPAFAVQFPRRRFTPAWGFKFLPKENLTIVWGAIRATTPPTSGGGGEETPVGISSIYGPPSAADPSNKKLPPNIGGDNDRTTVNNVARRPPPRTVGLR